MQRDTQGPWLLLGVDADDFNQVKAWSDGAACVDEPLSSRPDRTEGALAVAALRPFLQGRWRGAAHFPATPCSTA